MAERTIVWTKTADIQFAGVLEYWVKRNKSTRFSKRLIRLVSERTSQIAVYPFVFRKTNFKDIRVCYLLDFSIFYRVTDTEVIVLAFWDNRQNPQKLLGILKD